MSRIARRNRVEQLDLDVSQKLAVQLQRWLVDHHVKACTDLVQAVDLGERGPKMWIFFCELPATEKELISLLSEAVVRLSSAGHIQPG